MKRGTPDHVKTKRLARALGIPLYGAVGLLECIFHIAQKHAWEGDIGRLTDDEIAEELEWKKEPERLIETLVEQKWLDRCECHRLRVHDWPEHADQTVRRNLAKAGKAFLLCYADAGTVLAPGRDDHGVMLAPVAVAVAEPQPVPQPQPQPPRSSSPPGYVPVEQAVCPDCQRRAVVREKERYADGGVPGWVCSARREGCRTVFAWNEPRVLEQLPSPQREAVARSADRVASKPAPPSRRASLGAPVPGPPPTPEELERRRAAKAALEAEHEARGGRERALQRLSPGVREAVAR
jgi:hypothetical protein